MAANNNDRPLNFFRAPKRPVVEKLIADISHELQSYEQYYKLRVRKRKADDQDIFEKTVSAIICDLIHLHLTDPQQWAFTGISHKVIGRKSVYRSVAQGKKLPDILEMMASFEMEFIETEKGSRQPALSKAGKPIFIGKQTRLKAGKRLVKRIEENDINVDCLTFSDDEQVVILKETKTGPLDKGKYKEYPDTAETKKFRDEVREINSFLRDADLACDDPDVDISNRRLRRFFNNGRFDCGGRLFGGFWQNISSEKRRTEVLIDGEYALELDYGQMGIKLLYSYAKKTPPDGDLYIIPEFKNGRPMEREAVKKLISSAIFADKEPSRMPKGIQSHQLGINTFHSALDRIKEYHAEVAPYFYKGLGVDLMFLESEIMVRLLLELKNKGIVALPIFDGILVTEAAEDDATDIMIKIFEDMTNIKASVSVELY